MLFLFAFFKSCKEKRVFQTSVCKGQSKERWYSEVVRRLKKVVSNKDGREFEVSLFKYVSYETKTEENESYYKSFRNENTYSHHTRKVTTHHEVTPLMYC